VTVLAAHGFALTVPRGWDARIRLPVAQSVAAPPSMRTEEVVPMGGTTNPILHATTMMLPAIVGDYGGGAVERLGPHDAFVAIVGFDVEAAKTALFARRGIPTLREANFRPATQQRVLAGASGTQSFFQAANRPYCLYVVVGRHALRRSVIPRCNELLRGLRFT